ncbi:MAG: hypothetical protein ACOYKA_06540 [Legionellaceae bacterium]
MPITREDLSNGHIYQEHLGTLGRRIDFAWKIYTDLHEKKEDREKALLFLIYAFDIRNTENINDELLALMHEKITSGIQNPEYIPRKTPKHLFFDTKKTDLQHPFTHEEELLIQKTLETKEMLVVNPDSRKEDEKRKTIYLKPEERASYRLNIVDGHFMKNGGLFDSSSLISHGKKGFVAYTLNSNGELSVFEHHDMKDRMAHSSMNAGYPVVAAGELKIEQGELKIITTHSGHYNPSLFNVYRALAYFSHQGMELHSTKVMTFNDPSRAIVSIKSSARDHQSQLYLTSAIELFKHISLKIKESIESIDVDLKNYRSTKKTFIYKIKDVFFRSDLTKKRTELALNFEKDLETISKKTGMPDQVKAEQLQDLVSTYEKKNKTLSLEHGKSPSNGRLAKRLLIIKHEIALLNQEDTEALKTEKAMKKIF